MRKLIPHVTQMNWPDQNYLHVQGLLLRNQKILDIV
jgi:hypothetical protein